MGDEGQCCAFSPAGSFDNFLNIQIVLIIGLQIAMCLLHGGLDLWWRNKYGVDHYALALTVEGQVSKDSSKLHELCRSIDVRASCVVWLIAGTSDTAGRGMHVTVSLAAPVQSWSVCVAHLAARSLV